MATEPWIIQARSQGGFLGVTSNPPLKLMIFIARHFAISSSIEYMGTIVAYSQITAVFRNVISSSIELARHFAISSSIEYMGTIVAYSHSEFKSYAARF